MLSAVVQACLGFMDLIGISLIGLLGAISVDVVSIKQPPTKLLTYLHFFHIQEKSAQFQIATIGVTAAIILVMKTILSIQLTKRNLRFLSNLSANMSGLMLLDILSKELIDIESNDSQTYVFAMTDGVNSIMIGIFGTLWSLFVDASLLLILGASLFVFDPFISTTSTIFFGGIALTLYWIMRSKLGELGEASKDLTIKSNKKIIEAINSFRELLVSSQRTNYAESFLRIRQSYTKSQAEIAFMPHLSKYVFESSLIVGGLLVSALQFAIHDSQTAITSMTVFIAASSRIVPAMLRIQFSLIQLNTSKSYASSALNFINEFSNLKPIERGQREIEIFHHDGFIPNIDVKALYFKYPSASEPTLSGIDLEIRPGQFVAIVGPSGAGKSTLVDVILGVLKPISGEVLISGIPPREVFRKWPGCTSYLPQDVYIVDSTISENITFPFQDTPLNIESFKNVLSKSHFNPEYLKFGADGVVGENGSMLSGGQKQRLGMARALYTNPSLLVLDEATSALDADSENRMSQTLKELHGKVTILVIAHRLSTVRHADEVIYLESGKIRARGTFDSLRFQVPDFDRQANLMGIS